MTTQLSTNPFDLSGRVALVTGAGRGIGRAIAIALAEAGADIAVAARSKEQLDAVCAEAKNLGREAISIPADLADLDELSDVFEQVQSEFGKLDILFNNAGTGFRKPLLDVTPDDWDQVADLNLRSLFFACQHGVRLMSPQGYGRIINTASLTSFLGFNTVSVYGATKGGVAQLTKALAVEFAESGITVNAIAPGYVYTELTRPRFEDAETRSWLMSRIPQGRHGEPEDMTGTAVFLASAASAYVTGVVIPIDGGWLAG